MTRKMIFLAVAFLLLASPIFAQTPGRRNSRPASALRLSRHGHRLRPLWAGSREGGRFGRGSHGTESRRPSGYPFRPYSRIGADRIAGALYAGHHLRRKVSFPGAAFTGCPNFP